MSTIKENWSKQFSTVDGVARQQELKKGDLKAVLQLAEGLTDTEKMNGELLIANARVKIESGKLVEVIIDPEITEGPLFGEAGEVVNAFNRTIEAVNTRLRLERQTNIYARDFFNEALQQIGVGWVDQAAGNTRREE